MIECDRCGDSVSRMCHSDEEPIATDEYSRWWCLDCQSELDAAPSVTGTDAGRPAETAVTDGGTAMCPDCSSPTVNVHGITDCVACNWSTS